jgi:hypothetical protein
VACTGPTNSAKAPAGTNLGDEKRIILHKIYVELSRMSTRFKRPMTGFSSGLLQIRNERSGSMKG